MNNQALRIAIVEDNDDLRESLMEVLQAAGQKVTGFACAEELDGAPAACVFDLVLLDLNLPGEDGLSLAARLRHVQPGLRVIMMTTRTGLDDRIRGYDAGADLYLPKPIAEDELLAAVRAIGRQIHADEQKADECADCRLRLDLKTSQVLGAKGVAFLNPIDLTLLSALARAPGQKLEYWQLIEATGQEVNEDTKANLSVRMTRLRTKLIQTGCSTSVLKANRSSGYQLCVRLKME